MLCCQITLLFCLFQGLVNDVENVLSHFVDVFRLIIFINYLPFIWAFPLCRQLLVKVLIYVAYVEKSCDVASIKDTPLEIWQIVLAVQALIVLQSLMATVQAF